MIWEIDEKKPEIEGLDASGRPDPAYAAALGLLRAPFGRRALAAVCDYAIWLVLQLPLWLGAVPLLLKLATGAISPYGLVNHPNFVLAVVMASVTMLLSLVFAVVQWIMHGLKGRTIGKSIAGIRTVDVATLERPRVGKVLLRFLIVGASGVVPLLGPAFLLISPVLDPEGRGRGLHDKAAKVWLVDVRRGLNPYDEKRMRVARKLVKTEPVPERSALPSLATPDDPAAQPQYRPGSRISAGVLGVARPHEAHERPGIGVTQAPPVADLRSREEGKPVLGGYRGTDADRAAEQGSPHAASGIHGAPQVEQVSAPASQSSPVQAFANRSLPELLPEQTPQIAPERVQPAQPVPAPQPQPAPVVKPAPIVKPAPVVQPQAVQVAPAPQTAVPPTMAARLALRLDTGESIAITEPVLLGRNPDAAEHRGARPVALTDDSRSLSKTHLLVRPVENGLELIDCGSTNGSGLIRSGAEYALAAGVPATATDGDMIRLGDRVASVVRL